ncbi:hypothetical protein BYT27DRAFT_7256319 [Phlegmacium glaucopus]|nr:hypothetical protein BYT27DRAFT_7256319 [Phlegmacium glaucopus]
MEFSHPRPSILSLFDPLSLTPDLDRTTSPDSDKENDFVDTSDFFYPFGTHKHIDAPPRTLKRRLVDVGDTTVEHPDIHGLLSDELEQELSYIVDDDDENDTLTFRDMAKAATPKWSSRNAIALESPKASPLPRTPLTEISLKDELTPLARKKPYKRQLVFNTPKGSQSACLAFPPLISSNTSSSCPPSYAVPEVRVNDEPVPQSSSIISDSLGDSSSSLSSHTLKSTPIETMVAGPSILSSSLGAPAPSRAQLRPRHLSPASPADNANRYSVDLQTSFQIHFPSHDTTFDLLKDKVSFFGSGNEFDSFFNNLEGDSSLDDDISMPGRGSEIESMSGVSSNQAHSVVKSVQRLIDHPTPVSKGLDVSEPSKAGPTNVDALTAVQPSISNQIDTIPSLAGDTSAKTTFVQHALQTPFTSPPLPLMADNSRPLSTPSSSADNSRHPLHQIPALRIVKRSKTITQQKQSITKDALIPVALREPVTEASMPSSLATITKGHPSEVSQVQRTDKAHLPPPLASNGPRRVLISEGPKLNSAPNTRASANLEQVKHSNYPGPRRVATAVPPTIERASSSTRPPIQPSSGLRQPVKYGTSVVKPVQRTAGSRLPAITRRIGAASGVEKGMPRRVT